MNSRKFANLFAFIAIGFISTALVIKYVTTNVVADASSNIAYWCDKIAYYLACLVTIICAFSYASAKRNNMYMFLLIVFVVIIILFTFFLV